MSFYLFLTGMETPHLPWGKPIRPQAGPVLSAMAKNFVLSTVLASYTNIPE